MKRIVISAFSLLLALSITGCEYYNNPLSDDSDEKIDPPPEGKIRITGQTRTPKGEPSSNAFVWSDDPTSGVFTDSQGSYTIDIAVSEDHVYLIHASKGELYGNVRIRTAQIEGTQTGDIQLDIEKSTINVYVRDENGTPIEQAIVEETKYGQSFYTDENGFMSLTKLDPNKEYTINVWKKGYEPASKRVTTLDKDALRKLVILHKTASSIEVLPEELDFGKNENVLTLVIQSKSGSVNLVLQPNKTWISLNDNDLFVEERKPEVITVEVNREKIDAEHHDAVINIRGPNIAVTVKVKVEN